MTTVFAFANQKGGVGKTTTVVSLAACLAEEGLRILVVDLDPQANATSSLGLSPSSLKQSIYEALLEEVSLLDVITLTKRVRLDLAPSSPALAGAEVEMVGMLARENLLRRALDGALDRYDFVLIDPPPSLGLLTLNALTAADGGVIIPVQCEYLALEGLSQLMNTVNLVQEHLNPLLKVAGIVLTMYDMRTKLSEQVAEEVRRHFPGKVFQTVIPRNIRLGEAPSYGETIMDYAPHSRGGISYRMLTKEMMTRFGIEHDQERSSISAKTEGIPQNQSSTLRTNLWARRR
ncbi:MAG: ParA family protein [Chloroflexi bacterium]|nr:ParA family protein [Chloroflexota bacterium]